MPIYDDTWNPEHYKSHVYVNLRDLTKNHLGKLSLLKFDFVDYKVQQQIACYLYERMLTHCFNQYGILEASKRMECADAQHYFETCLTVHQHYALIKKYDPEILASSYYARYKPHLDELAL